MSDNRQFQANGLPVKTRAEVLEGLRSVLGRQSYGAESAGLVACSTAISPDLLAQAIRELEALGGSVTEREAVLRERSAFEAGANAFGAKWFISGCAEDQAAKDYPLPVRLRPLQVRLGNGDRLAMAEPLGDVVRISRRLAIALFESKVGLLRYLASVEYCPTPDELRRIAGMLGGETEEVPEGEE